MIICIQQECSTLIKSVSKDFYIVTKKNILIKCSSF